MSRTFFFLPFLAVVLGIFGLLQFRVYRALRRWAGRVFIQDIQTTFLGTARIVLVAGNALVALQFALRGSSAYAQPIAQFVITYPAGIFFAAVVFGFLLLAFQDVFRFLTYWVRRVVRLAQQLSESGSTSVDPHPSAELSAERRKFLKWSGVAAIGVTLGPPLVSSIASAHDYRITKIPLSFPNLPAGLHGLSIAQVSDVHSGVYMTEDHMMEIVELTNSLHANIVALTGDHVDSSDVQIPSVCEAMKMLRSDYGVYGCLGNHDHFATAEKVSAALQQVNVVMLDNAHRTLRINSEKLSFVGVDDAGYGSSNFARLDHALEGIDPESFKILLSHRPEFFRHAKKAGMDLTLAGHTHGGQVGVEFWGINLNPAYLVTKYVRGLFVEEGKQMYVNVGVGMVAVPIRIVRPEITFITLQRSR